MVLESLIIIGDTMVASLFRLLVALVFDLRQIVGHRQANA